MDEAHASELGRALDRFLESAVFEDGLSERTLAAYGADLRAYLAGLAESGVERPGDIVREDITDHLLALGASGLAARSVARHLSGIRRFHRFLAREQLAQRGPSETFDSPRIGLAKTRAMPSGSRSASRFGPNSPIITDKNVMPSTTTPSASQ